MRQVMLTTEDNPYNPFDDFDDWYAYDEQQGYHSCAYLDRVTQSSDALSPEEQMQDKENAIDDIVRLNVLGNYKKLVRDD